MSTMRSAWFAYAVVTLLACGDVAPAVDGSIPSDRDSTDGFLGEDGRTPPDAPFADGASPPACGPVTPPPGGDPRWVGEVAPVRELFAAPDGRGGEVVDYSTRASSATPRGGPRTVAGVVTSPSSLARALAFDGIDDQLELDATTIAGATTYTISLWISTTGSAGRATIFAEGSASSTSERITLGTSDGVLRLVQRDDDGTVATVAATGRGIADGAWHHVGAVREPGNVLRLLIDDDYSCRSTTTISAGRGRPDGAWECPGQVLRAGLGAWELRWSPTHRSG